MNYETKLSPSALDLYSNFQEILEYHCGYSEEQALRVFAKDIYTSDTSVFEDMTAGVVRSEIFDVVHQCSYAELKAIAKIDRSQESASISEKLVAVTTLLEGGDGNMAVEDAVKLVVSGSSEMVTGINSGNITADLIETIGNGELEFDHDELPEILEQIAQHAESANICRFVSNGMLSSRADLESALESRSTAVAKHRSL